MRPTRPMNIKNMIVAFPMTDKSSVTPKDIPQVPNADVISKISAVIGIVGSVTVNTIAENMTIRAASKITA